MIFPQICRAKTGTPALRGPASLPAQLTPGWLSTERPLDDLPVQKLASAFLYISQISGYLMGNMQNREGLSMSRGSVSDSMLGMLDGATVRWLPDAERLVLMDAADFRAV